MGFFDSADSGLTSLLGQWNVYSTGLVTIVVILVTIQLVSAREPDIHPMLLARQSAPSTVRQEGESAVYRSQAAPHGMPLNSGLNVKDPGASKWSRGRDGDLRDVWRRAATGGENGAKGKLLTVWGSQRVDEHNLGKGSNRVCTAVCVKGVFVDNLSRGHHASNQLDRSSHR
jgi:hypothetical protein